MAILGYVYILYVVCDYSDDTGWYERETTLPQLIGYYECSTYLK